MGVQGMAKFVGGETKSQQVETLCLLQYCSDHGVIETQQRKSDAENTSLALHAEQGSNCNDFFVIFHEVDALVENGFNFTGNIDMQQRLGCVVCAQ